MSAYPLSMPLLTTLGLQTHLSSANVLDRRSAGRDRSPDDRPRCLLARLRPDGGVIAERCRASRTIRNVTGTIPTGRVIDDDVLDLTYQISLERHGVRTDRGLRILTV
jgi:hypothetical protein